MDRFLSIVYSKRLSLFDIVIVVMLRHAASYVEHQTILNPLVPWALFGAAVYSWFSYIAPAIRRVIDDGDAPRRRKAAR